MTEQKIAQIFEQVGLAKIVRELANDELMNAVQGAMIAIAQEQPSLPEGLDEAAAQIAHRIADSFPFQFDEGKALAMEIANQGARAGAEWMAGQGIIIEGKMDVHSFPTGEYVRRSVIAAQSSKLLQVEPDDVIVQIRKK